MQPSHNPSGGDAVVPVTGVLPKGVTGGGELTHLEMIVGMVHAVRATASLCPPAPGTCEEMVQRSASGGVVHATGHWAELGQAQVQRVPPVPDSEIPTHERLSYQAEFELSQGFKVRTHAPAVFGRIMQWCGCSGREFVEDWSAAVAGSLSEEVSRGKSASTFLFSASRRLIVKTVNAEEFGALLSMLPSYYAHLVSHPNSLLNPHLGAFCVSRKPEKRYFTVMANILPPPTRFSVLYDLKGSTFKRAAGEADKTAEPPLLKDNDYLEGVGAGGKRFSVPAGHLRLLLSQISADAAWLKSHNRMDYSLLVGVVDPGEEDKDEAQGYGQKRRAPLKNTHSGLSVVLNSASEPSIVIGIIDLLQDYNIRKQVAHTLKTRVGGADDKELSTVPAAQYAARFVQFAREAIFEKRREVHLSFFINPNQVRNEAQSRLHGDGSIAVGDVVGRTTDEFLTLDLFSPQVKSICVVTEVKLPKEGSEEDEGGTHVPDPDRLLLYSCSTGSSVLVNVVGPVFPGDVLVPSGKNDGTAIAFPLTAAPMPPHALGVVDNIVYSRRGHHKTTQVRAVVSEVALDPIDFHPDFEFQKLYQCPVEGQPLVELVQPMWVPVSEFERRCLARTCVMNPADVSVAKISPSSWLTVSWITGSVTLTKSEDGTPTSLPVRCATGNHVITKCISTFLERREKSLHRQILSETNREAVAPLVLEEEVEVGEEDEGKERSVEELLSASVTSRADRSFGGWLRDWLFRGKGQQQLHQQQLPPPAAPPRIPSTSSRQQAERAMQRYQANQKCLIAVLLKPKGLFRRALLFLAVPDIRSAALVSIGWSRHAFAPELWAKLLPLYHVAPDPDTPASHRMLSRFYPSPRRHLGFQTGEAWTEVFGLRYPSYHNSKQRVLEIAAELDLYDLIFQRHLLPQRTVLDFALFERRLPNSALADSFSFASRHLSDLERAVAQLWPALRSQWQKAERSVVFDLVLPSAPESRRLFLDLANLRQSVIVWLDGTATAKIGWEGPSLVITFPTAEGAQEILARFRKEQEQQDHLTEGGDVVPPSLLSSTTAGQELKPSRETSPPQPFVKTLMFVARPYRKMELRHRVTPWREVKERLWQSYPGRGDNPPLRPANPSKTPLIPDLQARMDELVGISANHQEVLTECFEHHLFPPGRGLVLTGKHAAKAAGKGRPVDLFGVRDEECVNLPGQLFPTFIATSSAVLVWLETNPTLPELTASTAAEHPLGHLSIEGHGPLQNYALFPLASCVCDPETLRKLLLSIDIIVQGRGTTRAVYTVAVEGQLMPDGVLYKKPSWVCNTLQGIRDDIEAVLKGKKDRLDSSLKPKSQDLLLKCLSGDITEKSSAETCMQAVQLDGKVVGLGYAESVNKTGFCNYIDEPSQRITQKPPSLV